MFSDDETKQLHGGIFMRPGDEIISIQEVCINEKFDKRDFGYRNEPLLSNAERNGQDFTRYVSAGEQLFPDGDEGGQARFMWTEEDGTFAAMMDPGFGQEQGTCYGREAVGPGAKVGLAKDIPAKLQTILPSEEVYFSNLQPATSSSSARSRPAPISCKVDKSDPRSRFHFLKYLKRQGRTIKLWECGICRREFQHQYTLMRHLPTHTDERNFHCHACGKSFRQLSTLSQHRAIHSVERPYSCEVCSKNFNRVSTLISHRKTHSEDKPYKCHMCPKGFHQKGNLRNHLFTHTNERPYRCNLCEKGFNQQSNLVCHKNKAHPEDPSWQKIAKPRSASAGPRISQPKQSDVQPDSTSNLPITTSNVISSSSSSTATATATAGGVIVDAITTYHMGVALATRQMPFALLKPDQGVPVLVKVVDTKLPGGKQMLVPATAEDLRNGGKIVMHDNNMPDDGQPQTPSAVSQSNGGGGVQIRVPVVATVVPRARPGGGLLITVEEPHGAERHYHTAYDDGSVDFRVPRLGGSSQVVRADSTVFQNTAPRCVIPFARTRSDVIKVESSSPSVSPQPYRGGFYPARDRTMPALAERPPERSTVTGRPLECFVKAERFEDPVLNDLPGMESITSLLSSPGSSKVMCAGGAAAGAAGPPFDLMVGCNHMDLFEWIPLGPQITAVHDVQDIPHSDESAIFIGEYEELRVD